MTVDAGAGWDRLDRWFSLSIIFLPFLYQYKGMGSVISLGEIWVAAMTLAALWRDRFSISKPHGFLLAFYLVSLVTTILCGFFQYFSARAACTVIARMLFYALVISVAREHFRLKAAEKVYVAAVGLFSVYLLTQFVYHRSTGKYLPIYLRQEWLFPPERKTESLANLYQWMFRPSSLFLEPSYFALFSMPSLCLLIFKTEKTKTEVLTLLLVIAALLVSTALSGLGGMLIVLGVYFLKRADVAPRYKALWKLLILVLTAGGLTALLLLPDLMPLSLGRLGSGGSFANRILRGFMIFARLPLFHQVFGVGLNNLEPFMLYHHWFTSLDEANLNYAATIAQTLNCSGVIGLVSLLAYLGSAGRTSFALLRAEPTRRRRYDSGAVIALYGLLIFVISYEAILFTYRFCFLIILLEALQRGCADEGGSDTP